MEKGESGRNIQPDMILGREKLEEKRMSDLIESALGQNPSNFQADWNMFRDDYEFTSNEETRRKMIEARKLWIEMKDAGKEFEDFINDKMSKIIKVPPRSYSTEEGKLYQLIKVYESLGYSDGPKFLGNLLNSENILRSRDGSVAHTILSYLQDYRDANSVDFITEYLSNINSSSYGRSSHREGDIMAVISSLKTIVGTEQTMEIIGELSKRNQNFSDFISNPRLEGRLAAYLERPLFDEQEPKVIEPFDKAKELARLEELKNIPLHIESTYHDIENYTDNYDEDNHDYLPELPLESPQDAEEIAIEAKRYVENLIGSDRIEYRVGEAARLHVYNVMRRYSRDDKRWQREMDKIFRMSEIEKKYSERKDLLPTIGIEIETPMKELDRSKRDILNELHIKNEDALDVDRALWEVNPGYSHSPLAQSRVLQELGVMGALPIHPVSGKITGGIPLSLHINLGFLQLDRFEVDEIKKMYGLDINYMNDLLTYAFASPYRIQNRKTNKSYKIELANDADYSSYYGRDRGSALLRLELRAGEFKDYPTFRLLSESQALAASLIAFIKSREGKQNSPSHESAELALLWPKIRAEIEDYLAKYGLDPNDIDNSFYKRRAIEAMFKPGFKDEARKIVSKYAKMVLKEVFPKKNNNFN